MYLAEGRSLKDFKISFDNVEERAVFWGAFRGD